MSITSSYSSIVQSFKNGKRCIEEQTVIVGSKGIKIKYYHIKNDKKEKISITCDTKPGSYIVSKTIDGVVVKSTVDIKGLSNELKSTKLKFAKEYIKDVIASQSGGKPKSNKPIKTKTKRSKK